MMDALREAMTALSSEAAEYSNGVRVWMKIMMISFFSGLAFTPWRREARWIVGIMAVTALCLIIFKALLPDVPRAVIGSVVHLVLWPVALVIAWAPGARAKRKTSDSESVWGRLFFFWLLWVSLLIGLSLLMDVREVASLLGES